MSVISTKGIIKQIRKLEKATELKRRELDKEQRRKDALDKRRRAKK